MAPKLYMVHVSPLCRSILLVAKELNIDLEEVVLDFQKGELKSPEYLKLNPQHAVPTLVDGDFVLPESHAIVTYLVEKYGKDKSTLYPKELNARARVDQMLYFDDGILFASAHNLFVAVMGGNQNPEKENGKVIEAYEFIEIFLNRNTFIAGPNMTVADLCILATVSLLELFIPIDLTKFPKFAAWLKKLKALPSYQVNEKGLQLNKTMIQGIKAKNQESK